MTDLNKEMSIQTLSSLSEIGACKKRRKYLNILGDSIVKAPIKSTIYKRAEICSDTIVNALKYNERDKKNIMTYMNGRYVEAGFINPQQKKQVLLNDWFKVMRYLDDEKRAPSFPKSKIITLRDEIEPVRVSPHVAFECGDQIELVLYKIGKPNVSQKGDKNKLKRDLQLYSMVLYGRELGFKNITASFYFLRKDTDGSNKAQNEAYFFGGGGNIVNMSDLYDGKATDLDEYMDGLLQEYIEGINEENQDEDTCKYCQYYNICKYKSAPIAIEAND